jgi:hypothetical protein
MRTRSGEEIDDCVVAWCEAREVKGALQGALLRFEGGQPSWLDKSPFLQELPIDGNS